MAFSHASPPILPLESATTDSVEVCTNGHTTAVTKGESEPPTPDGSGLPPNFAEVLPGLYRSSYPTAAHFSTLQEYGFKTIVTLVGQEYPAANVAFMKSQGIAHYQIPLPAHKEASDAIPREDMVKVLLILLDPKNYPLLLHCNKGKHRTGCTIACLRKVTGWAPYKVIDEYRQYSAPKSRSLDELYIGKFDCSEIEHVAKEAGLLPSLPSPAMSLLKHPMDGHPPEVQEGAFSDNSVDSIRKSEESAMITFDDPGIHSGLTREELSAVGKRLDGLGSAL